MFDPLPDSDLDAVAEELYDEAFVQFRSSVLRLATAAQAKDGPRLARLLRARIEAYEATLRARTPPVDMDLGGTPSLTAAILDRFDSAMALVADSRRRPLAPAPEPPPVYVDDDAPF